MEYVGALKFGFSRKKNTLCHLHRNKWEDSLSASKQSSVTSQYTPPPHSFCNTIKNQIKSGLRMKCLWHFTCTFQLYRLQALPGYLPRDAIWYTCICYMVLFTLCKPWSSMDLFFRHLLKIRSYSLTCLLSVHETDATDETDKNNIDNLEIWYIGEKSRFFIIYSMEKM